MMNEVQTMICTVERKRFSKLIYVPLVFRHIKNTIIYDAKRNYIFTKLLFLYNN
jgi:hypothetical protein